MGLELIYFHTHAKQMFRMSLSVHPSVCPSVSVSICVQNTSVCQGAGRGIKVDHPNAPSTTWDKISYCLMNKDLC